MQTAQITLSKRLFVYVLRRLLLVTFLGFNVMLLYAQSAATSIVTASSRYIIAGGATTLTIQLKDVNGTDITSGGSSSSLTFVTPSSGTIGSITDNSNGTYSAVYTAGSTAGAVTITPRLSGTDFTNTVTINVGAQLLRSNSLGNLTNTTNLSTTGGLSLILGLDVEYLVVGGGGGGGGGVNAAAKGSGAGGGGGWVYTGSTAIDFTSHTAIVGSGGSGGSGSANGSDASVGTSGRYSSIFGISAAGGTGGGGGKNSGAQTELSGDGGNSGRVISGTQTNTNGGANNFEGAGGGAGSGSNGSGGADISNQGGTGGNGGSGTVSSITGTSVTYGGGGGGGGGWDGAGSASTDGDGGNGGSGGGGNGSKLTGTAAASGITNLGGGGGGGGYTNGTASTVGGSGGSGIIVLKYQGTEIASGGTRLTANVHSFTSNGTFSLAATNSYLSSLSTTYSGVLSGTGALTYNNLGTLDLTGINTYTGGTNIQNGTVKFSTSFSQADATSNVITLSGSSTLVFNRQDIFLQHSGIPKPSIILNSGTTLTNGGTYYNVLGPVTLSGGTLTSTAVEFQSGQSFAFKGTVTVNGSTTSTISGNGFGLGAASLSSATFDVSDGSADEDLLVSGVLRNGAGPTWPTAQASALTKTGAGKMVLTGANTYTGITTISAGTFQIGNGSTTGEIGSGNIVNNSILSLNRSNSYTVSNIISGTGTLIQSGSGTTILTGTNTYSGTTTISAGTLQIGSGSTTGVLGSGDVINNAALIINRSDNLTVSNLISGIGTFTKSGSGILTLSATNTYTGATTISAGELRVNGSIASSSGLTVSSGTTLSGTGALPATTVSGTHAPGTSPGVQSVSGNLTYNAGSSINWELIGNTIGTRGTNYDGIDVTGNLNFAGATTLNLIFNGAGSSVDWTNAFWSTAKAGVNGWKLFEVTGTISNLNNITVNATSQWIDINSKVLRTQRISNGTFALEQVGTAVYLTYTPLPLSAFAISGINSVVQVNTAITGIQIRAVDENGTTVSAFTSTATLSGTANFTGTTASFAAGVLTTSLTPATTGTALTLIVTNSTYSISGTATFDVVSSLLTGARVVDGTSGSATNAIYYSTTGGLTLSQGFFVDYLIVGGGGAGGNFTGGGGGAGGLLTNVGGTPLQLSTQNYTITVGGGGTPVSSNRGGSGSNSSAFSFTAIGGGGGGSNNGGTATGANGGSGGGGSSETGGSGGSGTSGQGSSGGSTSVSVFQSPNYPAAGGGGAGGAGNSPANSSSSGGAGGLGFQSSITGTSVFYAAGGGGGVFSGSGGSGGSGVGGTGGGSSTSVTAGAANTGSGGGGNGRNGSTGAGAGGSGIVILRYPGTSLGNNIVGGTVNTYIGNGSIGSGTVDGMNYNVHTFTSSGDFNLSSLTSNVLNDKLGSTLTQSISGSGALTYSGPGRLVLSANSTYTGNTTISAGTLQIGNGSTTGSLGTGSITNNGTLSFQRSNDYTVPGAISGTGTVEQFGAGTLNLGGLTNHQAGTWTLRSGSISNGTITSGNFSMIDGTASAVLGGTGALTKTGGGTVTLSGNNTYSGTTTVSAGTLIVNGTNSGSGAVTVASGAVLKGTGTIAGATTIQSGATLEPGNRLGTLNLGGGLTLNGGGHLNFLIDDASGIAGTDWNSVNVTGALTINATSGSKFNINVGSILANGTNGELANFSPTLNTYSWTILTATSITGFDTTKFQINLDASNGMGGLISKYKVNGFSIVQDGNTLKLTYSPPAIQAIDGTNNGTETTSYTTNTSANSLTLNQGLFVDYLLVGGGGAGGNFTGGGGGAGGLLTNVGGTPLQLSTQNYTITVGGGGTPVSSNRGGSGSNSSAFGFTAIGGGGGGSNNGGTAAGANGGSGGGGSSETGGNGGSGTTSQGNSGGNSLVFAPPNYPAAGGGGAVGAGNSPANSSSSGGAGGVGFQSSITGTTVFYAAGGGGGVYIGSGGSGGSGVGGTGGGSSTSVTAGAANTGSGGGGNGRNGSTGAGAGGSGVVIIRYEGASLGSVGGTVTSFTGDGANGKSGVLYQVHTFNSSSNFNLSSVSLPSRLRATLTGNVVGTGNLIYAGPGVLSLTGTGHTYTGSTSITAGELRVNSSIATSSGVSVSSGATLSGTGTLPATTVSGTHAPGTSPGVQTVSGNLTYNAGSSINWELISNAIGTRGTDYDGIDVTGNLNFAGATTLNLIFNSTGSLVDWADNFWRNAKTGTNGWKLFEVSGSVSGLNNVTVTLSSAATDKDGDLLSAQRSGLTTSFSLVQDGTGIFISYNASAKNITWTGTTSNSWSTTTNWTPNGTPTTDNSIVIGTSSNAPSFTGTATYRSLTVNTGATFNITSGTMSIYEDVTNNGTITGAGTLQLNGTTAQTISGTGTIGKITINNTSGGVSIASGSNKQYITGVFTPTSGVTTTNGNLVFRSTASAEGVVGTVGTCPTEPISGNVTVEKYIPAKRAFRFLTPGVTTTSTIKANWQEGGVVTTPGYPGAYPTDATANPNAGYGTHITGAGGAVNGFDETVTNNPSLFTFNPNSNLWVAAANTNSTLSQGEAYRILFRGSRAVNMNDNAATADATTLRTTGTLKVCNTMSFTTSSTIPLNPSATGYSFIGNPYWSVVDWHTVTKSGVEDNLYYWDPTMNGTNGRGAYVTYSALSGLNNVSPAGASQVSRYIQPGQAFFVRNTTATPTLTIAPTDIVGSSPSRTLIFSKNNVSAGAELGEEDRLRVRGNTSTSVEKIYVSLLLKNKLSSGPADGFVVAYANNFTDEYGREDAAKFGNLDENISAFYKGVRQSILGMQSVSATQLKSDTIPVSMSNLYDGEYVMRISVDKSVDPSREIYLLNRITNQQTKVDNLNGLDHAFLISAGVKTKDDLALVVNSRRITAAPRSRKQLVVYPNPLTTGVAEIIVPNTDGKMKLFNSMSRVEVIDNRGQVVLSEGIMLDAMGRGNIDVSGIASGGYVVRVYVGNQVFTSKLLKQ